MVCFSPELIHNTRKVESEGSERNEVYEFLKGSVYITEVIRSIFLFTEKRNDFSSQSLLIKSLTCLVYGLFFWKRVSKTE